jgi:N-acetyl-gamma-glutamylphosphate reductase
LARRKDATERARLLNAADVAFLCLPDAAAREAASLVSNPRTCLIDASTAHRTRPDWVFGLPELAPGQRSCAPQSASRTRAAMPRRSSCCCARWSMPASCRPACP